MDNRLHIHRNALSKSDSAPVSSHFQTRPNTFQAKQPSQKPLTQTEIENQEFQQHKFEATKLEIQAKYGTITPEGQERLTVLQAKMSGLLQKRVENVSSFGHSLTKIALKRPDTPPPPIQTKLTIGQPGDKYEQEADQVAAKVVSQINAPERQLSAQGQTVQREELPDEEDLMMKPETDIIQREEMLDEEDELQMKPMVQLQPSGGGMTATPDLEAAIQQARGSGQPLANTIREPMEQAFGADFSGVKVHTDASSDQLNQSIQAKAFTTGQDVFFRQGEYNPGSRGGQELIAHELTHVMQQKGTNDLREPVCSADEQQAITSPVIQCMPSERRRKPRDADKTNPYSRNPSAPRRDPSKRTRGAQSEEDGINDTPPREEVERELQLWDGTRKQMKWYPDVEEQVLLAKGEEQQNPGLQRKEYKCVKTRNYYPMAKDRVGDEKDHIQIDHQINWKTYVLEQVDPQDFEYGGYRWSGYPLKEVLDAYNHMNNLVPLNSADNASKGGNKELDSQYTECKGKAQTPSG